LFFSFYSSSTAVLQGAGISLVRANKTFKEASAHCKEQNYHFSCHFLKLLKNVLYLEWLFDRWREIEPFTEKYKVCLTQPPSLVKMFC